MSAGGDPGVAFYQDGAYVSDQTTTNTSLFDVQRVEVLRGPQGALLGRNAVGGAISIISAPPTDDYHGSVSGTVGDYGRADTEGFVSGPLGSTGTDLRISYQVKNHDGYITNEAPSSAGGPRDFDDLHSQTVRVQSLTHLPEAGTLRMLFSFYNEADHGDALAVTPTPGVAYPAQQLYGAVPSSSPWRVYANSGLNRVQVYTANLDYEQPLGFATLSLTGNYRGSTQHFETIVTAQL